MADVAVVAAVSARLSAAKVLRADGTPAPILDPNKDTQPPADGQSYITLQFPVGTEDMITAGGSVGNRLVREEGTIRLVVSTPRGDGQLAANTMIETLRALFRFKEFAGVRTFGASPAVDNDSSATGAWWVLSTSIPYWFDFAA